MSCIEPAVKREPSEEMGAQVDGVLVSRSSDHKCGRCWRLLPEVTEDGALCGRCETVVA